MTVRRRAWFSLLVPGAVFAIAALAGAPVAARAGWPSGPAIRAGAVFTASRDAAASSVDARFLTAMLADARAQLALARLAAERPAAGSVSLNVAVEAGALWQDVDSDLEALAHALRIAPPPAFDPNSLAAAIRLARTNGAAFDAAYLQSAARADRAAMQRMESLDAGIDPRILFFADRALPSFLRLENALRSAGAR